MGSLCCIFEIFSKFNTGEALNIFGGILIDVVNSGSGNSLNRISALGADVFLSFRVYCVHTHFTGFCF